MPANDFLRASDQELRARANQCLERAGSALELAPRGIDDLTRLHLFLEAQSCIAEVLRRQAEQTAERDRQRNEEIAERDFRLERRVVRLIGAEIILSIIFGVIAILEGWQQGKILAHMDTSTAATSDSLQKLIAVQNAEMRPWIVLNTETDQSFAAGKQMVVNVEAKNIGHSPATRISKTDIHFRIFQVGPKLTSFVKTFSIDPVPQSPGAAMAPNDRLINTYFGDTLTPEEFSRLISRSDTIIVYARIDYSGPLRSENYYTEMCRLYSPVGLHWHSCAYHTITMKCTDTNQCRPTPLKQKTKIIVTTFVSKPQVLETPKLLAW